MLFKNLIIVVMAAGLFGCSGSPAETPQPPAGTTTPSPVPSPTHFKFEVGYYVGENPEIGLQISEEGELFFNGIQVTITDEDGSSGPCEILVNNARNNYPHDGFTTTFNDDGSFLIENKDIGTIIKGAFSGAAAQGTFSVKNCGPFYDYATPHPADGTFTASWFATPTPEPTPLPPVNGQFAGENVSFYITDGEGNDKVVKNFRLQVNDGSKTCTFSQDGQWTLDSRGSIAAYFNSAVVSFHVTDKSASGGFSQTECGGGTWRAIWVGP